MTDKKICWSIPFCDDFSHTPPQGPRRRKQPSSMVWVAFSSSSSSSSSGSLWSSSPLPTPSSTPTHRRRLQSSCHWGPISRCSRWLCSRTLPRSLMLNSPLWNITSDKTGWAGVCVVSVEISTQKGPSSTFKVVVHVIPLLATPTPHPFPFCLYGIFCRTAYKTVQVSRLLKIEYQPLHSFTPPSFRQSMMWYSDLLRIFIRLLRTSSFLHSASLQTVNDVMLWSAKNIHQTPQDLCHATV